MKKTIAIFTAVILAAGLLPVSALAHDYSADGASSHSYRLCGTANCNASETHMHSGSYYYGHTAGDGHDYHKICDVQGCAKSTSHQHNGTACLPHSSGDGHGYHNSRSGGGCHR